MYKHDNILLKQSELDWEDRNDTNPKTIYDKENLIYNTSMILKLCVLFRGFCIFW